MFIKTDKYMRKNVKIQRFPCVDKKSKQSYNFSNSEKISKSTAGNKREIHADERQNARMVSST